MMFSRPITSSGGPQRVTHRRCGNALRTAKQISHRQQQRLHVNAMLVHESLCLLPFGAVEDEDAVSELVDKLWSMQYVVPGPICGCAGKIIPVPSSGGSTTPSIDPPASHAVFFRYGQPEVRKRFLEHLKTKEAIKNCSNLSEKDVLTYKFDGSVPNELEAIFRKGPYWDVGHELIIALKSQDGSSPEDGEEFLNLTQQLATSSAYGAVQASYGRLNEIETQPPEGQAPSDREPGKPDFMLLVRFLSPEPLAEFVTCPPVVAMLEGDDLSPVKALWAGTLVIEPTETNAKQQLQGGLM